MYMLLAKKFGVMLKLTAILTLCLLATLSLAACWRNKKDADASSDYNAGAVWAQSISCDSCGSECASACGTRHFRSCCFNYLRKKRPDNLKMRHYYMDDRRSEELPVYRENIPDDRFDWVANEHFGLLDGIDERD